MIHWGPGDLSSIQEALPCWGHAQFATAREGGKLKGTDMWTWVRSVGQVLGQAQPHCVFMAIFQGDSNSILEMGKTEAQGGSARTPEPWQLRQGVGRVHRPGADGAELEHGAALQGPCLRCRQEAWLLFLTLPH